MILTVTLNPSLDEWVYLPSLRVGALNRASAFARYPGGKGINVSRVIQELGGRTKALAFSGGEDGAIFRHHLRGLSIPHEIVSIPGATRNNYKIQSRSPASLTEINAAGPALPSEALRALQQKLFNCLAGVRCVVLAGSLPRGAPSTIYRQWIQALGRLSVPVALDACGEPLRQGLRARPWLIKPNRQEAEELLRRRLKKRSDGVRAARELARRWASLAVLSLGGEGALMASAASDGVWFARAPKVAVDSAVGAGDSLVGGFLMAISDGCSAAEALRWGVASGTAAAMTPGTELCHRADVRRLLRRVSVRRLV